MSFLKSGMNVIQTHINLYIIVHTFSSFYVYSTNFVNSDSKIYIVTYLHVTAMFILTIHFLIFFLSLLFTPVQIYYILWLFLIINPTEFKRKIILICRSCEIVKQTLISMTSLLLCNWGPFESFRISRFLMNLSTHWKHNLVIDVFNIRIVLLNVKKVYCSSESHVYNWSIWITWASLLYLYKASIYEISTMQLSTYKHIFHIVFLNVETWW